MYKQSFSGEVKDSVIVSLFVVLHELDNPLSPPCLASRPSARTQYGITHVT
jgi:hypothetical protein